MAFIRRVDYSMNINMFATIERYAQQTTFYGIASLYEQKNNNLTVITNRKMGYRLQLKKE